MELIMFSTLSVAVADAVADSHAVEACILETECNILPVTILFKKREDEGGIGSWLSAASVTLLTMVLIPSTFQCQKPLPKERNLIPGAVWRKDEAEEELAELQVRGLRLNDVQSIDNGLYSLSFIQNKTNAANRAVFWDPWTSWLGAFQWRKGNRFGISSWL